SGYIEYLCSPTDSSTIRSAMSRLSASGGVLVLMCGADTGVDRGSKNGGQPSPAPRNTTATPLPASRAKCPDPALSPDQVRTIGVPLGVMSGACAGTGISSLAARAWSA